MTRQEDDRRDRRDLDRKFEKIDTEIKNVASVHAQEMGDLEKIVSDNKGWIKAHEVQDEERWKANGEKWTDADKKFDGMDTKLNTIIGTSLMTLLAVCGFFLANFIERQDAKKLAHIEPASLHAQTYENQ